MAERRQGGAGRALAGILEKPEQPEADETEQGIETPEPPREVEAPRATKKRKVSRVSSKRPGVQARTVYMHDDLWILIRGKAIKRRETVSEFASWVFESHFGVQAGSRKRRTSEGGESDAA